MSTVIKYVNVEGFQRKITITFIFEQTKTLHYIPNNVWANYIIPSYFPLVIMDFTFIGIINVQKIRIYRFMTFAAALLFYLVIRIVMHFHNSASIRTLVSVQLTPIKELAP